MDEIDITLQKEAKKILIEDCWETDKQLLKRVKRKNKKYRKQIYDFLENLKRDIFKSEYILQHKHKIEMLKWLKGYYEERAATTPEKYLESILNKTCVNEDLIRNLEYIKILYYWINYKKIEGF